MELVLYRGINVLEPELIISDIKKNGLYKKFLWEIHVHDIRNKIDQYFIMDDLTTVLTRAKDVEEDVICACGDSVGAAYYSIIHNSTMGNSYPIVIKFKVSIENIFIDGKDFLYPVFQLGTKNSLDSLKDVYGESIEKYFYKAMESDDQDYRIAMCDLACQDKDVIYKHYSNDNILKGRCNTTFKSAFFIRLPVSEKSIIGFEQESEYISPQIDIDFRDLIKN